MGPGTDERARRAYHEALDRLRKEGFEVRLCGATWYPETQSGKSFGIFVDCIYWYK